MNNLISVLAEEADTSANRTSGQLPLSVQRGIRLIVKIGALTTTPTFTPSVQIPDGMGGWVTIWTAAAAISAAGTTSYLLYPSASMGGSDTEKVNLVIGQAYRVVLTFGGSGSAATTEVIGQELM